MPRNALPALEQVLVAESDQLEHPVADVMAELTLDGIFQWQLTRLIQDNLQVVILPRCTAIRCTSMNMYELFLVVFVCQDNFAWWSGTMFQERFLRAPSFMPTTKCFGHIWSLRLEALQKQNSVLACLVCRRCQNLWRWVDMGQPTEAAEKVWETQHSQTISKSNIVPGITQHVGARVALEAGT